MIRQISQSTLKNMDSYNPLRLLGKQKLPLIGWRKKEILLNINRLFNLLQSIFGDGKQKIHQKDVGLRIYHLKPMIKCDKKGAMLETLT